MNSFKGFIKHILYFPDNHTIYYITRQNLHLFNTILKSGVLKIMIMNIWAKGKK